MKRAAILLVAPLLLFGQTASARTATNAPVHGVLRVSFFIRAAQNDEAWLCSDHDFIDAAEADTFVAVLGPRLGFGGGRYEFDPDAKNCLRLFPTTGFTEPGPRAYERTFTLDGGLVAAAAFQHFKLSEIEVHVCFPELPRIIEPAPKRLLFGGDCDHPSQSVYLWTGTYDSPPQISISFRATPASLLRGILGDAAYWAFVAGVLWLITRSLRRRRWRLFDRHRLIAWPLNLLVMLIFLVGAIMFAPYWSGLIPSLQLYLRIGVIGEAILVSLPALTLAVFVIAGPIRVRRQLAPSSGPPSIAHGGALPGGIPSLEVPGWSGHEQGHTDSGDPS